MSVVGLERALQSYCEGGAKDRPFDLKVVPVAAQPITALEPKKAAAAAVEPQPKKEEKVKATRADLYAGKRLLHGPF